MACFIMSIRAESSSDFMAGLSLALGTMMVVGIHGSSRASKNNVVLCSTNHVASWISSKV